MEAEDTALTAHCIGRHSPATCCYSCCLCYASLPGAPNSCTISYPWPHGDGVEVRPLYFLPYSAVFFVLFFASNIPGFSYLVATAIIMMTATLGLAPLQLTTATQMHSRDWWDANAATKIIKHTSAHNSAPVQCYTQLIIMLQVFPGLEPSRLKGEELLILEEVNGPWVLPSN